MGSPFGPVAELVDALDSKSSSARSVGSSPTRATRNKTPRNVGVFLWPGSDEKESDQKRSRKIENFVGDLSPEIKHPATSGCFLWGGSDEKESDQKRSRKIENFVGDLSPEIKHPATSGCFLWGGSDEKESDQKRSRKIENFVGDLSPEIKMSPTGNILFSHSNSTQNTNLYHPVGIRITHYYVIIPYQPHTYPQTSPLGL